MELIPIKNLQELNFLNESVLGITYKAILINNKNCLNELNVVTLCQLSENEVCNISL